MSLAVPTREPSRRAPRAQRRRAACRRDGVVPLACRFRSARCAGGPRPGARWTKSPPRPSRNDERCRRARRRVSRVQKQCPRRPPDGWSRTSSTFAPFTAERNHPAIGPQSIERPQPIARSYESLLTSFAAVEWIARDQLTPGGRVRAP